MTRRFTHPLRAQLRDLRKATGLSLTAFAAKYNMTAASIGAYERGDRVPSVDRLAELLDRYGYELVAVPKVGVESPIRTSADWARSLRDLAETLDRAADKAATS